MPDLTPSRERELFQDKQHTEDFLSAQEFRISVRQDLQDIKTALIGNDMGTPGILPRLMEVEKRQNGLDSKIKYGAGFAAAISAACTGLATWWAGHK